MKSLFRRFVGLWRTSDNTSGRFVRASAIVIIERFVIKGVQFVRTIILARLLFPEDLGLFGLAAVSLGIIDVLFHSGFNSALIREKDNVEKYLHTAWTVQVIRNSILATVVFLTAPYFGNFFEHPEVIPFIRVMALTLLIDGFVNIGAVLFQKDLAYNKRFVYNLSFVITEIIVVIIAAYWLRSPWALVIGSLANRGSSVLFSYVLHPFRPHFEFDTTVIKHLFSYGKWVTGMSIVSFLITQGDYLVIGKMLGAEALGYYQPAFALALIPVAEFGRVLGGALFPMFAKMDESIDTLREGFIRAVRLVFAFTVPITLGLYVLASDFVHVVYGERWLPMVPIISILVFYCLIRTYEAVASPFFMGIGKPRIQTEATVLQCVVMFLAVVPLTGSMGVVGTALAVLMGGVAGQAYLVVRSAHYLHLRVSHFAEMLGAVAISGLAMLLVLRFAHPLLFTTHGMRLVLLVALGSVTYLGVLYLSDALFGKKIWMSLRWIGKRV
jgi:lipopolysaccharide exporter